MKKSFPNFEDTSPVSVESEPLSVRHESSPESNPESNLTSVDLRSREVELLNFLKKEDTKKIDVAIERMYENSRSRGDKEMTSESLDEFRNYILEQISEAFVKIAEYDQFHKSQNEARESILSSLAAASGVEHGNVQYISEGELTSYCLSINSHMSKFESLEQFEWFCSEVKHEYSTYIQHGLSPEHYVSTDLFLNIFRGGVTENMQTFRELRDISRAIVGAVMDKKHINFSISKGEEDSSVYDMLDSVCNLTFNELQVGGVMRESQINAEDKNKLINLYGIVEQTIRTSGDFSAMKFGKFFEALKLYSRKYSILDMSEVAFEQLCKDLLSEDRVEMSELILGPTERVFSQTVGGMGIGESFVYSYSLHKNPADLGDLVLSLKEASCTDQFSHIKNRQLAVTMQSVLGYDFREIIHEQDPYAQKFVDSLITFYETGNIGPYNAIKNNIYRLKATLNDKNESVFLSRETYTKTIADRTGMTNSMTIIEALHELRNGMEPSEPFPPETGIEELDNITHSALDSVSFSPFGNTSLETVQIIEITKSFNSFIDRYYSNDEMGININVAFYVSWLERQLYPLLQSVDNFEDQQRAFKQEWFQDILRFYFSIHSVQKYDKKKIDDFIKGISEMPERNYRQAYQTIGQEVIRSVSDQSKEYTQRRRIYTDTLWGGGLAYQIMSYIDERPPQTEYERRFIQEKKKGRSTGLADDSMHHQGD